MLALDPVPDNDGGWATSCELAEDDADIFAAVIKPRFRVVVQPELSSYEDAQAELDFIIRVARSREVGNCIVMVDELSPFFRKGREAPEAIQSLVRFGRRQNVGCLLISQRAYDCPVEVRSQLTDLFVFRLVERDIEHLSQFIGRRNIAPVLALGNFQFVHYDLTKPLTGGEVHGNDDETRTLGDGGLRRNLLPGQSDQLRPRQRDEADRDGLTPESDEENDE